MLVQICVHSICIILLIRHKYSVPLQHRRNCCQPTLPTPRRPSRANDGAPSPAPTVSLLFQCLLTSVHPTPPHQIPIQSIHPIRPIQSVTSQRIKASVSWYDPADTIRSSRFCVIQPIIQYDPVIVSSYQKDSSKTHPHLPHCLSIHILYHISCWWPLIWFSPSQAASSARHLLSSSSVASYADFFASDWDSPIPKAFFLAFLISSPAGQSLEETRKCLMEPHRHCFCSFFSGWLFMVSSCASSMLKIIVWNYIPGIKSIPLCLASMLSYICCFIIFCLWKALSCLTSYCW